MATEARPEEIIEQQQALIAKQRELIEGLDRQVKILRESVALLEARGGRRWCVRTWVGSRNLVGDRGREDRGAHDSRSRR